MNQIASDAKGLVRLIAPNVKEAVRSENSPELLGREVAVCLLVAAAVVMD